MEVFFRNMCSKKTCSRSPNFASLLQPLAILPVPSVYSLGLGDQMTNRFVDIWAPIWYSQVLVLWKRQKLGKIEELRWLGVKSLSTPVRILQTQHTQPTCRSSQQIFTHPDTSY